MNTTHPTGTRGRFTLALGGDVIGPGEPVTPLGISSIDSVSALFRTADAGFANHESSTFDLATFEGTRAAVNGGGYPLSPPSVAADLRAFGLSLLSKANNHATDWGAEGLLATERTLTHAGIVTAGSGCSRADAQRPRYLATPKGRIALISFATTFTGPSVAGSAGGRYLARPGIFAVRVDETTVVTPDDYAVVERIAMRQSSGDLDDRSSVRD
ncbi:MAG: CapA family protein, partial [Microbacterium sp.]